MTYLRGNRQGNGHGWNPNVRVRTSTRNNPSNSDLVDPSAFDVLLGRGKSNHSHPGNQLFEGMSSIIQNKILLTTIRLSLLLLFLLISYTYSISWYKPWKISKCNFKTRESSYNTWCCRWGTQWGWLVPPIWWRKARLGHNRWTSCTEKSITSYPIQTKTIPAFWFS